MKIKNGFTLIELLAVIVVLSIVMVIATQQVNKIIKNSRLDSYVTSINSIKKSADLACAQNDLVNINDYVDNSDELVITVENNNINVSLGSNSKFQNLDEEELKKQKSQGIDFSSATKENNYKVIINNPCGYENNQKTYVMGEEFCLGDECFYTISDNGSSVTALAKYLLLSSDIQSSSASGKNYNFSSTNYWHDSVNNSLKIEYGSNYPAFVYDSNSTLYSRVKNYENKLNTTYPSISVTIPNYEVMETLGCNAESKTCKDAPSWVYSVRYWTGVAASDLNTIYAVPSQGSKNYSTLHRGVSAGIRPVITISKNEI